MIRFTEEGQELRKKYLSEMRERLDHIKKLNIYKGSSEWASFKKILESLILSEKHAQKLGVIAIDNGGYSDRKDPTQIIPTSNDRIASDIRVARKGQLDFELVIDLVEKTDEKIEHLTRAIKAIESEFKQAKEQLA